MSSPVRRPTSFPPWDSRCRPGSLDTAQGKVRVPIRAQPTEVTIFAFSALTSYAELRCAMSLCANDVIPERASSGCCARL